MIVRDRERQLFEVSPVLCLVRGLSCLIDSDTQQDGTPPNERQQGQSDSFPFAHYTSRIRWAAVYFPGVGFGVRSPFAMGSVAATRP